MMTFDWDLGRDVGNDIAFAEDEVVVAGSVEDESGLLPLLLWLSDDGGVVRSVVRPADGDPNEGPRTAHRVHADALGLVAVGADLRPNVWLARYSWSGELAWESTYSAMVDESGTKAGSAVTIEDGTLVLFGEVDLGGEDPGRIAYFDEATLIDQESFGGPPLSPPELSNFSGLQGIMLSPSDALLVAGASTVGSHVPWMQRRVLGGEPVWEISLASLEGALVDSIVAVALRSDGTFVVAAEREFDTTEMRDAWIGAFSGDGVELWSDTYVGEYHSHERPSGVAVDAEGNAYLHLTLSDDSAASQEQHDHDLVLIKYDAQGSREWLDRWSGEGSGDGLRSWDYSGRAAVDAHGFIVVTGRTYRSATDYDVVVRKIAP